MKLVETKCCEGFILSLSDCKRRHTDLAIAWIDYNKAYEIEPHNWTSKSLEMSGIANNVQNFLKSCMKSWKLKLKSSGKKSEVQEMDFSGQ